MIKGFLKELDDLVYENEELIRENIKLKKELKKYKDFNNNMFKKSMNQTAEILTALIEKD